MPVQTVDIGIPILAMHSARELMGFEDMSALSRFVGSYFQSESTGGKEWSCGKVQDRSSALSDALSGNRMQSKRLEDSNGYHHRACIQRDQKAGRSREYFDRSLCISDTG